MVGCGGNALDSFRSPAVTRTDCGGGVHCGCTVPAQPMRAAATRSRTCRTETRAAEPRSVGSPPTYPPTLLAVQCSAVHLVRNNGQRATLYAQAGTFDVQRAACNTHHRRPACLPLCADIGRQGPGPASRISFCHESRVCRDGLAVLVLSHGFIRALSRRLRRSIRRGAPSV